MKRYLLIVPAAFTLITLILTSCGNDSTTDLSSQPKAAIIDQLYLLEPNQAFVDRTTDILEASGFRVDLWQGEDVTVEFYRELPKRGYKLIVLRVHSGLLLSLVTAHQIIPSETTYLFTGETYTTTKYVSEQLTDRVSNALMTTEYPLVFAVNSEFIKNDMEGSFDNTAIIAMGCESQYFDDMADAFIQKGASVYIGWSGVVSLDYTDNATLDLISNLYIENMTAEQSIAKTMTTLGFDPYFRAYMKFYPTKSGSKTIAELVE